MITDQEIPGNPESLYPIPRIRVVPVDKTKFISRIITWPEYEEVYNYKSRFVYRPLDFRIANTGATLCLIAWVFNLEKRSCLSGHFIFTDIKSSEVIQIPNLGSDTENYNFSSSTKYQSIAPKSTGVQPNFRDEQIETYISFLDSVGRMTHSTHPQDIEVHLFGQNFPNSPETVYKRAVIEHIDVRLHLGKCRVHQSRIYDHRKFSQFSSDTLFDPETQSLWWLQTDWI